MSDRKYKLTVDDLIIEYMIMKVKLGYEPSYTTEEFITFLYYFDEYIKVVGATFENEKEFDGFYERIYKSHWTVDRGHGDIIKVPHIERKGNILVATNRLSDYDSSITNIYFMGPGEQYKIRSIIASYLERQSKRKVDSSIVISDENIELGQLVTASFVNLIWNSYIREQIKNQQWPMQCIDINKYLFDVDLAKVMMLPSLKDVIMSFYADVSKKVSYLAEVMPDLEISNSRNCYLPYSNYEFVMEGYDRLMRLCDSKVFNVRTSNNAFVKSYNSGASDTLEIKSSNTKKLVRTLNESINKR